MLLIYLVYWYREQKRWEKATPEERRDMERASQDERNQFLWGQAAYFSWQVTLIAIAPRRWCCRRWTPQLGCCRRGRCLACMCCPIFGIARLSQKF